MKILEQISEGFKNILSGITNFNMINKKGKKKKTVLSCYSKNMIYLPKFCSI